jgi:hypothetical protein
MKVARYEGAGLALRKAARPGSGRDDRQLLAVVKPHPSDQEPTFRSSLAGRTSLFTPLPGTSYRATFNRSTPGPPQPLASFEASL